MKSKTAKIFLNDAGSFLGRGEGCLIVRDRKRNVEKYPLFENEIGEVQIKIGNSVSSGALATCAFWGIDVLILTQRGNPVAYLKSLEDDSHVKNRICQYEAMKNGKAVEIAKSIVLARISGQNQILIKYGLRQHDLMKAKETISNIKSDNLVTVRKTLLSIEGKHTEHYFHQIFQLMPKAMLIQKRIRESYVAIVGAGGLGSRLIQQLAFLGVGKLAIIDSDELKATDLNRLVGSRQDDIPGEVKKVDIAKRLVHSINQSIEVTTIPKDLIDEESFSVIKKATCVFGCVDNDGARLVLNELCAAFGIPYLDTASDIRNETGLVYGGRIFVNFDDNGCLYCYDLISSSQARAYLMSPKARKDEETIYGIKKEHLVQTGPSVVSINGVIASLAATEFMVMIVGLRSPNRLLQYHGHRGMVNLSLDQPRPDCYYCKYVRGRRESADVDRYWRTKIYCGTAF